MAAHKYPPLGSVSSGTLRPQDLLLAFADVLERYARQNRALSSYRADIRSARTLAARIEAGRKLDESDDANDHVNGLIDALNEIAPPHAYFGAHPGDGSDFGYWIFDDIERTVEENDGVVVSDLADVPVMHRGDVLYVNDHGNATLYWHEPPTRRREGKLTEIWSIV
jgi:hypothetical protein